VDLGVVIDDRFVLEARAGAGGMATVYRAHDRATGGPVAIKVLERQDELNLERFEREARVVAELSHPGLVRYIAHGVEPSGIRYLVMEWLDGCDLAERLVRGPLGVATAIALVRRAADALAAAHARGIIHRDVKPSNLFLVDERADRIKIVDFGLARVAGGDSATRTGSSIGTPRYMAPEQVRGRRDLDARVDVYGLGGVLFNALTGRPPFPGADNMAILAKVLLEDPPRVRELVPEVPAALDELVEAMLAKDRLDRPDDAAAVVARLDAIAADPDLDRTPPPPAMIAVTGGEQRLLSVVLIDTNGGPAMAESEVADVTSATRTANGGVSATIADLITSHGGRFARLPDGSVVITVAGTGTATDQAAQAARLSLSLRGQLPATTIALATGRGQLAKRQPTGDVIDRAAELLRAARARGRRAIVIDDVTHELLGERFGARRSDDGGDVELVREREPDPARTLLGRVTPCVGRDAELAMLEAVWQQCVDDGSARAVLVTGDAGAGKSRLRYELIRRLRERTELELWIARGDPLRAGAAFGMLAPAIRRAAGVLEGEPLEVRQHKLRARASRYLTGDDAARVTEFLGELVGVPFPDEHSPRLRTARHDPRLMNEQMRHAWEDWVGAETAITPLLIVLEDLHWGDWPTVKFIDSMLVALAERAILVLALARPDVKQLLPGLWEGRPVSEISLGSLSRRASERLVKDVLGDRLDPTALARVVEQAAGNALFLEELIRAVAEGKGAELPASVLAMVQGRLDRLPAEARRVLRAASVFSNLFWAAGVEALVGGDLDVGAWIDFLVDQEVVARRGDRKFPDQDELVFRHALVRDAAYSLLTEADRRLGHRRAAEWLEKIGETNASILAEHLERGGELERAAQQYRGAAEQALEASDLAATTARATQGLACLDRAGAAAIHPVRGALHLAIAQAASWAGRFHEQALAAERALSSLVRGEELSCRAAAEAAHAYGHLGQQDALIAIGEALCDLGGEARAAAAERAYVAAAAGTATQLVLYGHYGLGDRLLALVQPLIGAFRDDDPAVAGAILRAAGVRALSRSDLADCIALDEASVETFVRAGDLASAYRQRCNLAAVMIALGAYGEARATLADATDACDHLGMPSVAAVCRLNLGLTLNLMGDGDGARIALERAARDLGALGMTRTQSEAHADLSHVFRSAGDLVAAQREADRAVALSAGFPPARAFCLAERAQVALAAGRPADALVDARDAQHSLDALGGLDRTDGEPLIRLSFAEALDATGDREAARAVIAQARTRLEQVADRIGDPMWRKSFLERVAANVRIFALDRAWNGGS
jgi:eukaryotic-like serine/threonine-protein kinase